MNPEQQQPTESMNKENAHLFLHLVQALADGKTLQLKSFNTECWEDFGDDDPVSFSGHPEDYRIKPEPRTWDVWLHMAGKAIHSNPDKWHGPNDWNEWKQIKVQEVLE
jgi:hypothetical protein